MEITCSTNPRVMCKDCLSRPVVVLNGHQSKQCAHCLSADLRLCGGLFSDFSMQLAADRLDELIAAQPGLADA
jgi:hypothetical protein